MVKRIFRIRRQSSSRVSTTADDETFPSKDAGESLDALDLIQHQQQPRKHYPLDLLPNLCQDLRNFQQQTEEKNVKILRKLFTMSEQDYSQDDRVEMVRQGDLVPCLLEFLESSTPGSCSQNIALLVLNNLTIPPDNKKIIVADCGAARVLAKLLEHDPSCHLVAIVVVNLAYSNIETRTQLVDPSHQLVESLVLALLIASMTREEYTTTSHANIEPNQEPQSLSDTLRQLVIEMNTGDASVSPLPSADRQLYPETARWALAALKNLTRPSFTTEPVEAVIRTGVAKHLVRTIALPQCWKGRSMASREDSVSSDSHDDTPIPADPVDGVSQQPSMWEPNTPADSALTVIMNLLTAVKCQPLLREAGAVRALCTILDGTEEETLPCPVAKLQRMKARQSLAFVLGSAGYFGQASRKVKLNPVHLANGVDALIVSEAEARELVALLADLLDHRDHNVGPGGYTSSSFTTRGVLFALRCFLTRYSNVVMFSRIGGPALNALLLRVISLVVVEKVPYLDLQSAGHAVFSLYLLSDMGFSRVFLPDSFGGPSGYFVKLLTAYKQVPDATPAVNHAIGQLIQRCSYLKFDLYEDECVKYGLVEKSDLRLDGHILFQLSDVVPDAMQGTRPRDFLADRAVVRTLVFKAGVPRSEGAVERFASALEAAKDFSFGSLQVRHLEAIDDVRIANNISKSADGEKAESYNYLWSWEDAAPAPMPEPLVPSETSQLTWHDGATSESLLSMGDLFCSPMTE